MAGSGVGDGLRGGVDEHEQRGRRRAVVRLLEQHRGLREHLRRRDPKADEGADDGAELGHLADGRDAMAGDVSDDERVVVVIEDDALVPVAAHADVLGGGEVARRDVEVTHGRQGDDHAVLQRGDQAVLGLGQPGALEGLTGHLCDRHEGRDEGLVEHPRAWPGVDDRADDGAGAAPQRQGGAGAESERGRRGGALRVAGDERLVVLRRIGPAGAGGVGEGEVGRQRRVGELLPDLGRRRSDRGACAARPPPASTRPTLDAWASTGLAEVSTRMSSTSSTRTAAASRAASSASCVASRAARSVEAARSSVYSHSSASVRRVSRVGPSKSTSWSQEIVSVPVTWPRVLEGEAGGGHHAGPPRLRHQVVRCVGAPVLEGPQEHGLAGADDLGDRPALVQRHLGRGDDDARVGGDGAAEAKDAPVAVDQADAGGGGVQHRRELRPDHDVDLVDGPGGGQGLGHVGGPGDHAARSTGRLVVRPGPAEEQDQSGDQQRGEGGDGQLQRPVDLARVLHLHGPGPPAHVDASDDPARRRRVRGRQRLVPVVDRDPATGRQRLAHRGSQVRTGVHGGDEANVGGAPLLLRPRLRADAVERLDQEVGHLSVAGGPHRFGEHRAAAVAGFERRLAPLGVGEEIEADDRPGAGGLRDHRLHGVVERPVAGRHELAVPQIEDRAAHQRLEGGTLLRGDHRLVGEHADGRDRDHLPRGTYRTCPGPRSRRPRRCPPAPAMPAMEDSAVPSTSTAASTAMARSRSRVSSSARWPVTIVAAKPITTTTASVVQRQAPVPGVGGFGSGGRRTVGADHAVGQPFPKKSLVPDISSTPRT